MFKMYRVYDIRANDFVGTPLIFMSDAEASLWMIKQRFCSDLVLKRIAIVNLASVEPCEPEEVPYNAYEVDE